MKEAIHLVMRQAVEEGVFPGATLLVARRGTVLLHEPFGYSQIYPRKIRLSRQTRFDLASLTKPLATAMSMVLLIDRGEVSLSDAIHRWFPEFLHGQKRKVKIWNLLSHSSGLRAWRPYYRGWIRDRHAIRTGKAREEVFHRIHRETLSYPPGSRSLYSDLGFILAGEIIEKVSNSQLDEFAKSHVFQPLGLKSMRFQKVLAIGRKRRGFAATERSLERGRLLRGEVHDDNAYVMGGVAGHAGLFGTARDVFLLTQKILEASKGSSRWFPPHLVKKAVSRAGVPNSSWALGWDTPSTPSSSGRYFSSQSFGHLGFTGGSIWADRRSEVVVVLLTNRVHPTRRNIRIGKFRPKIHDLILKELVR